MVMVYDDADGAAQKEPQLYRVLGELAINPCPSWPLDFPRLVSAVEGTGYNASITSPRYRSVKRKKNV